MGTPIDYEKDRGKRRTRERGHLPFFDGEELCEKKVRRLRDGGSRDFPVLSKKGQQWLEYAEKSLRYGKVPAFVDDVMLRQQVESYGGTEGFIAAYKRHLKKLSDIGSSKESEKPASAPKLEVSKISRKTKRSRSRLRRELVEKYEEEGVYAIEESSFPSWLADEVSLAGGLLKWMPLQRNRMKSD